MAIFGAGQLLPDDGICSRTNKPMARTIACLTIDHDDRLTKADHPKWFLQRALMRGK